MVYYKCASNWNLQEISYARQIGSHLSYTNICLTIAIVSLTFINVISITARVSNAQIYTSPASLVSVSNNPFNIIITSNSNSIYSIPSTFVEVDSFNTNYTIVGKTSSLNDSRDLNYSG
jgi:hypothetical protein